MVKRVSVLSTQRKRRWAQEAGDLFIIEKILCLRRPLSSHLRWAGGCTPRSLGATSTHGAGPGAAAVAAGEEEEEPQASQRAAARTVRTVRTVHM